MADDDSSGKKSGALGDLVTAESMIQLALAVPGGCVVGWLIGDALDHHFHTSWIQIAGIVVGAVGGFLQIYRTVSRYLKRSGS